MADLHKFTTKEVLNKVLLDSSGNSVAALSHTSQEALNAVLDSTNNRLNVSLVGGTISGDVTISGDLTVTGDSAITTNEVIQGTSIIDVTNTEAFLVRKNSDAGDILIVDTTNNQIEMYNQVGINTTPSNALHINHNSSTSFGLYVAHSGGEYSGLAKFYTNSSNNTARSLVEIHNDNSSSDAIIPLKLTQDADGTALQIVGGNVQITSATRNSITKTSSATDSTGGALALQHQTSGNMIDNFGASLDFQIKDNEGSTNTIAKVAGVRDGGDTQGALTFSTFVSGSMTERMRITTVGHVKSSNAGGWFLYNAAPSSTVPAYAFADDTDTGMGQDGANNLTFISGGSKKLQIDSSGATFSDDVNLTSSSSSDSKPLFQIINTDTSNNYGGELQFYKNAAAGSDSDQLGKILFYGNNTASQKTGFASIFAYSDDVSDGTEDGWLRIRTIVSGTNRETLTLRSGNVGIGVNDPTEGKLVVVDSVKSEVVIKTTATATGTEAALMFKTSTGNIDQRKKTGIIHKDVGANGIGDLFFVLDTSDDDGSATVADNTAMVIKNNGNVGIGTTSPATLVEIQGGLTTTGAVLTLSTKEPSIVANDVLGRINFQAPLESDGGDAVLVGASIHALATSGFQAGDNPTDLVFSTAAGETAGEKMRLSSSANGILQIKGNFPAVDLLSSGEQQLNFKDAGNAVESGIKNNSGTMKFYGSSSSSAFRMILDADSRISLSNNDAGVANTVFGSLAGENLVSGAANNVYIGSTAGRQLNNAANDSNVAIGSAAMLGASSGTRTANKNIGIGTQALQNITTGTSNVAVGDVAMLSITTGSNNVALGSGAGDAITTDSRVVAIGAFAYDAMDTSSGHDGTPANGSGNMAIGYNSMTGFTDTNCLRNTAVGFDTMSQGTSHNPQDSVAVGYKALRSINDGDRNTAIGSNALLDIVTGSGSTAVGHDALENTTASECVGVGKGAGQTNTSGINNTFVGTDADSSGNFNYQTALGWQATTDGSYGVAIGMNGIIKYKTARVTLNSYGAGFSADNRAVTPNGVFEIPRYSHISKIWVKVVTLSAGTALYSIFVGSANDEVVGEVIADGVELLGANCATGCITRCEGTETANSDIVASSGGVVGRTWISSINVETDNSPGWMSNATNAIYVACAGTGNNQSDPGADAVLDIGVEYY